MHLKSGLNKLVAFGVGGLIKGGLYTFDLY
jgi:hypothetical protein